MNRKKFIRTIGILPIGLAASDKSSNSELGLLADSNIPRNEKNTPCNEDYWKHIIAEFERPKGFINFENGYFSHQPVSTLKTHFQAEKTINIQTSHFMRTAQNNAIEHARTEFAGFQGISPENLAFTRNTTESLNAVIMGYPWKEGDEVVLGNQDYGSMVEAFQQAKMRWNLKLNTAKIPLHPINNKEIIDAYLGLITENTIMVHITHMINLTGQTVPLSEIISAIKAKNKRILCVVDAAHSIAHLTFDLSDMQKAGADVVGGSLHKWLCNPIGVGFLYMSTPLIELFWPLLGDVSVPKSDIRKFEHQGTRPIHSLQTIPYAIKFHRNIGSQAKLNRLVYLKLLWLGDRDKLIRFAKSTNMDTNPQFVEQISSLKDLTQLSNIEVLTPIGIQDWGGAICTISHKKMKPTAFAKVLMDDHRFFTVGIEHAVINGIRITPHLSNSVADCLKLNEALFEVLSKN